MSTHRINYEIVGDNGLIICLLYSHCWHPSVNAETVFLDANKTATGPSDLIEKLLALRYPPPAPDNLRMFWIDSCPGDRERVIRVHYTSNGHVKVATDGTRWLPIADTKQDEALNKAIVEPPSLEQSFTASVARGSYLTTYVAWDGDITGITYVNSVEVDREMFSCVSKGLFTQQDLYDYALKRQTFLRAEAQDTRVPRRAQ